jgi:APA family basic amino acid/polyamine antiporter
MNNQKYNKNLSFIDLFFAGYGFIVGAGIFSLMPHVIKSGKGLSWLSFVIGGIVCLITGLSYAKLNSLYPSNDAEYSWILNILNFDKDRDPKKIKTSVQYLANVIIWIVVVIGLLMGATILVGQADIIRQYVNIDKRILTAVMVAIPSIVTMIGNKYATAINKITMFFVTCAFALLFGISRTNGKYISDNKFKVNFNDTSGLIKASFITIFAYNGFQSIVQLSEESKKESDIPLSIVTSSSFAILIYGLITISVISLIGINAGSKSVSPLADAYGVRFGKKGTDIVNIIAILALTNTILILTLSRSRLLQKLAVRGIAPNYLRKLTSLRKVLSIEPFQENKLMITSGGSEQPKGKTIPINAVVTLSIVTYLLTFIRKGAVDYLAGLTSSFLFVVFTIVNILVLVNYYKHKTPEEMDHISITDNKMPLLKGFPWYAVIGLFLSLYYLSLSRIYLDVKV